MMEQLVFAQALLIAGELDDRERELLRLLCGAAASSLALRLRTGLTPGDCGQDFVAAASLYAAAALGEAREGPQVEEFKAGDLTVRNAGKPEGSAQALYRQAERLMGPYLADSFAFLGV